MNRIADYALIGDCHSAALVGRDGSIDWACFPRFDSPSVFAKILDEHKGGSFRVGPDSVVFGRRAYLRDTNVIVTVFETATGVLEVTDCMPVERSTEPGGARVQASHAILRRARCTGGTVEVDVSMTPRFEYGQFVPRFHSIGPTSAAIIGGADALDVNATHPIEVTDDELRGRWRLHEDEEAWIEVQWRSSYRSTPWSFTPRGSIADAPRRLAATIAFWRDWMRWCWYEGDHEAMVRRSALTLKAMQYAPSGALVAAPTTSLPELIGGTRNWDYRYTWIRDSTLTLTSLFVLGFAEEADAFKTFLERASAGRPRDLQIMFGIGGERSFPEFELHHLSGHRGSLPVRIGNLAVRQFQLDSYGQILESAYLFGKAGGPLSDDNWAFLAALADCVCDRWRDPDHGIWEMRDQPRHFVHSKLHCWVALDRALRLASARGLNGDTVRWKAEREAIADFLLDEGAPDGWFQQASGHPVADASALLVPALGFVDTNDPRALSTIEHVRSALERDGLVYRYHSPDGIEGDEGAFLLCSFWLVDCLTHSGRIDEAEALLKRLLGFANDVGLFAEEVDPATGEPLGNFPQAFSHMALVLSCAYLSAAKRGLIPEGAHDYAGLAVERLLARAELSPPASSNDQSDQR